MPFQPGQSGNPSGRPKQDPAIRALARENAEKALGVFIADLESDDAKIRQGAAKEILDRAYGKPAQAIVGEADQPLRMVIGWAIPK